MGNQGTSYNGLRISAGVIKAGTLGTVREVHVWTNRPIWPQGGPRAAAGAVPANLNWDLWLGPAPIRPFAADIHPVSWRAWWDFGTGALGDMACHTVNMPYAALKLRDPVAVQAECAGHTGDSYPAWSVITFDYPATNERPAVKLYWYDGGKKPNDDLFKGVRVPKTGALVIGEKDALYGPGDYGDGDRQAGKPRLLSGEPFPEVQWTKAPPGQDGHFVEWINAIKGGSPAMSNFPNYAGGLAETILLGNLAVWVAATGKGEKVEWDAKNMKCTNIAGLETIVKPIYRAGYTLDA
jgi:predicted dehydrogenase